MRMRIGCWMFLLMAIVVCANMPAPAYAQSSGAPSAPATAAPAAPASSTTTAKAPGPCDAYAGLTHRVAGCIRESINQGAAKFFTSIYPMLQNAIAAVMTLAVIIYGILLAFGMVEKVGRDTFVLVLKLSAVVAFVSSSPLILKTVVQIMDSATLSVVTYSPPSGKADNAGSDFGQSICMQNMIAEQAKADKSKPVIAPWLGIDCLIDSVIGIRMLPKPGDPPATYDGVWYNKALETGASGTNQGPSRSLLFFFFSSLSTSVMGMVLAVVGGFFIAGLMMLIVRAFFIYIGGYMGVTFLVIVSPLFIPMVLFKETKQYFDKWAKLLISFALQPIIMLVFIIFSLTAVDLAAFSANYSIMYRIAGDESRKSTFDLNKYLTDNQIIKGTAAELARIKADKDYKDPAINTPLITDQAGITRGLGYNPKCTSENLAKNPVDKKFCDATYPVSKLINQVNWAQMEAVRMPKPTPTAQPGQQIADEVLASVFFCCMVVFILNGLQSIVPMVATDLLGDLRQSPNLGGAFSGKGSKGGLGSVLSSKIGGPIGQLRGK